MNFKTLTASAALSVLLIGCGEDADNQEAAVEVAVEVKIAVSTDVVDYVTVMAAEDRSQEDKDRDAGRKPAEVLALMGVKAGDVIIDAGAGSGYSSENLARAVGETGVIIAINTPGTVERFPQVMVNLAGRQAAMPEGVIVSQVKGYAQISADSPVDAVFFGQMYHEVIRQEMDATAINAAVLNALKPGGIYAIEIHNAVAGAGREISDALHRADPDIVRAEVLAAGFELVEENTTLFANPDDPLDIAVFDPSVRGSTDRTLFIFRKPS